MREILFKNLTAEDYKKRDTLITEVVEGDGVIAKIERRCKYFVTNMKRFDKTISIEEISNACPPDKKADKRDYFILRKKDDDSGDDILICKVLGTLFAVVDSYLFSVVYLHTVKIRLSTLATKK